MTNMHFTENSGHLDHLTPGDVIFADRGFDVQESVELSKSLHSPRGKSSWVALKWSRLDKSQMSEFMWRGLLGKFVKSTAFWVQLSPLTLLLSGMER